MVLASTVLAIALGFTPVQEGQVVQIAPGAYAQEIGRYSERTGAQGVRYLRGFDRHGRAYEVTIDTAGHVQGVVGDSVIEFNVAEAS